MNCSTICHIQHTLCRWAYQLKDPIWTASSYFWLSQNFAVSVLLPGVWA